MIKKLICVLALLLILTLTTGALADGCFFQLASFLSREDVLGEICTVKDVPEENRFPEYCILNFDLTDLSITLIGSDDRSGYLSINWQEVEPELLNRLCYSILSSYEKFSANLTEHKTLLIMIQIDEEKRITVADAEMAAAVVAAITQQ